MNEVVKLKTKESCRREKLDSLTQTNFDALIIGGGINGSVIANCLSANGYKIALIEKKDFASFTSQESSNLIWGGIKYLENFELSLVNDLCKSRNELMKAFPSRLKEIRFFATRYKGDKRWLLTYYLGAWLYQIMGRFHTSPPKIYTPKMLSKTEPNVTTKNASGSLEYSDSYLVDNDARFIYHFIEKSIDNNALALNYLEALQFKKNDQHWLTEAIDHITNQKVSISSKWIINAAGPFADGINKKNQVDTKHQHVFSKGVHLVVPKISDKKNVITFLSEDKRPIYIIPMQHRSCIGTTDTKVTELPPTVTEDDRAFILKNINRYLNRPNPLTTKDIIAERCGVRPLVVSSSSQTNQEADWLSISRKHKVEHDVEKKIISIFGGKLTDCLNTANETLEILAKETPIPKIKSNWYGEEIQQKQQTITKLKECFDEEQSERLWRRYGTKSLLILASQKEPINYLFDEKLYFEKEIEYILENEFVYTLDDLFRRRTELGLIYTKAELMNNSILKNLCNKHFTDGFEKNWSQYFVTIQHTFRG